jgi:hypothetical protein
MATALGARLVFEQPGGISPGPRLVRVLSLIAAVCLDQPVFQFSDGQLRSDSLAEIVDQMLRVPAGPTRVVAAGGFMVGPGGTCHQTLDVFQLIGAAHRADVRPVVFGYG